jgi:hypothetical protein
MRPAQTIFDRIGMAPLSINRARTGRIIGETQAREVAGR